MFEIKIRLNTRYSIQTIVSFILLICIICISIRYCDLHDYSEYYRTYMHKHNMTVEIGYTFISQLFYNWGLPFYVYYGTIITVCLCLIWRFFHKYSALHLFVFVVFIIYPYINELQQIRSAVGAAIVLTGLSFILDDEIKIVKYIISIIIAMLFHSTSVVYLIFIFAVKMDYVKVRKITIWFFVLMIPFVALIRYLSSVIFPLIPYFSLKYIKYVETGSIVSSAVLVDWILFGLLLVLITYCIREEHADYSIRTRKLINITYLIFILTLFRGLGNNGYRIALMMYPVMYVALSRIIIETKVKSTKIIMRSILCVFPVVCLFISWGPLFYPDMHSIATNEMWRVWNYFYD